MTQSPPDEAKDTTGRAVAATLLVVLIGCGLAILAFMATVRYLKAEGYGLGWHVGASVAYGLAVVAIAWLAVRTARRLARCELSPANRRYQRRVLALSGVYVFVLMAAIFARKGLELPDWALWAIAVAPALPILGVVAVMGLYIRDEPDEFQRAIHVEAALWATGGLLGLATVWGFLEMFERVPHAEAWWAFPVWSLLLGAGNLMARRRYR